MLNIQAKKMRVAIYLRVSTDEQAATGYGLDVQEEKLRAFLKSQDYVFDEKHLYRDEGYSGTLPINDRPELKRLFEDAARKQFDIVLVTRLDRFFRKIRLLLDAVETLNERQISFRSISESFDTSNATGRFTLQLLGSVAELERETIKERMYSGLLMAVRSGKWVMSTPPFGYRVDTKKKKLIVIPGEAKWIKKFFEWVAYERCSLKEVARRANSLQIKTKFVRTNSKRKSLGLWWPRTLGRMLSNEIYTGMLYFGKYKKRHKDFHSWTDPNLLKPKEDWISISVTPIVSRELFQTAVDQLKKNSEFAARKAIRPYLFSKLIHCASCGFKLKGNFATPKTAKSAGSRRYVGIRGATPQDRSKRCDYCGMIAESRLTPIWETLKQVLSHPELVYLRLNQVTQKKIGQKYVQERAGEIEKELRLLEQKRRKITMAYIELGELDEKEYKQKLNENEVSRNKLLMEHTKLNQLLINKQEHNERATYISKLFARYKTKLDALDYEAKSRLIHLLINRIDLDIQKNQADMQVSFSGTEIAQFMAQEKGFMRDTHLGGARRHYGRIIDSGEARRPAV